MAFLPITDKGMSCSLQDKSSISLLLGGFNLAMGTSSSDSEKDEEDEEDLPQVI